MKTALLIWELGAGMGHAAPLLALARALLEGNNGSARDVRPVLAFRDPIFARRAARNDSFIIVPVPSAAEVTPIEHHSGSYADLLAMHGFAKAEDLSFMLDAWDDLFSMVDPDLIIADHSPGAVLAASGAIPVVVTGNGFTVPPSHLPTFPALRHNLPPSQLQTVMLDVINDLQRRRKRATFDGLPKAFSGDVRAIFTLPHLDPYESLRNEKLLGPYEPDLEAVPLPSEPSLLYYGSSTSADSQQIVSALLECGVPVTASLFGPNSTAARILEAQGASVHLDLPPLAPQIKKATLVVSHGGSGITQAALKSGRAQIVMSNHFEALLTGTKLQAAGVGQLIEDFPRDYFSSRITEHLRDAIQQACADSELHDQAMAVAQSISKLGYPMNPIDETAAVCRELLA